MRVKMAMRTHFFIQGESKNFCHYVHATKYKL